MPSVWNGKSGHKDRAATVIYAMGMEREKNFYPDQGLTRQSLIVVIPSAAEGGIEESGTRYDVDTRLKRREANEYQLSKSSTLIAPRSRVYPEQVPGSSQCTSSDAATVHYLFFLTRIQWHRKSCVTAATKLSARWP